MTTEQKLDRLTSVVDALASTVVAHDNQIEGLIQVAERDRAVIMALGDSITRLERQFEAYLRRLPPQ